MTKDQVEALLTRLERLSTGGLSGPTGFEALCMAIGGQGTPGVNGGVVAGLNNIAGAIGELTQVLSVVLNR